MWEAVGASVIFGAGMIWMMARLSALIQSKQPEEHLGFAKIIMFTYGSMLQISKFNNCVGIKVVHHRRQAITFMFNGGSCTLKKTPHSIKWILLLESK